MRIRLMRPRKGQNILYIIGPARLDYRRMRNHAGINVWGLTGEHNLFAAVDAVIGGSLSE